MRRAGWGAAFLTVPLFALFHLAYGAGQVRGLAAVSYGVVPPYVPGPYIAEDDKVACCSAQALAVTLENST
jgi:hypothetical protein